MPPLEPYPDSPPPVAPAVSFDFGRDIPLPESIEGLEQDVYVARHNSIIIALTSAVDGVLAEADFPLPKLSQGLAFEASFCDAISGHLAIRGVEPRVPLWPQTLQCEASVAGGDALKTIVSRARADERLIGVEGVDVNLDDGPRRAEMSVWTALCGEKVGTAADWWESGDDGSVLDGAIAQTGRAALLYLSMERFRASGNAARPAGPQACLELLNRLLAQAQSIRSVAERNRDLLAAKVLEVERRLAELYCYLHPEEARSLGMPLHEIPKNLESVFGGVRETRLA